MYLGKSSYHIENKVLIKTIDPKKCKKNIWK